MKKSQIWDPYADFQKTVLPNGLSVYSTYWNRPWVRIGFVVHSGSLIDPREKAGTAHFVEHMASENIKDVSRDELNMFFKRNGGNAMFGSTGPVSTTYWFKVPVTSKILKKSIGIFGKMLIKNSLEGDIERERNVILSEFGEYFPLQVRYELYELRKRRMLYNGIKLMDYKGPLGDYDSITSITKEDLQKFHQIHYVPQNISIVSVGGLRHDELLTLLTASTFAKKISGTRNLLPESCDNIPLPEETEYCLKWSDILNGSIVNVASYASFALIPNVFNKRITNVFIELLNKLLDDRVRQTLGKTYSFKVTLNDYFEAKEMRISGKINPDVVERMNEIIADCLGQVKNECKLFDNLKTSRINWNRFLDSNGQGVLEDAMNDLESYHRIFSCREEIKEYRKVTFENVCELADYVNQKNKRWTLIETP